MDSTAILHKSDEVPQGSMHSLSAHHDFIVLENKQKLKDIIREEIKKILKEALPITLNTSKLDNQYKKVFDKPICEAILDQNYFNGIGNYLRSTLLYYLDINLYKLIIIN